MNLNILPQVKLTTIEDILSTTNTKASNTKYRLGVQVYNIRESFYIDSIIVSYLIKNESAQVELINIIQAKESYTKDNINQQVYYNSN